MRKGVASRVVSPSSGSTINYCSDRSNAPLNRPYIYLAAEIDLVLINDFLQVDPELEWFYII